MDLEDFASAIAPQQVRLLRIAVLLTGNVDAGEEILASAIARVYERWRRGRIDDVGAYLRRAVINEAKGGMRRRAVERRYLARLTSTPLARADDSIADRDRVRRALLELPHGQRAVVVLRYYEDLSTADTARVLGVTAGTVKTQLARSRDRLRELLSSDEEERDE